MNALNYTKRELEILEILWHTNGTDSTEIIKELAEGKLAFSTISMTLRMMKNKGLVNLRREKNRYLYTAVNSKEEFFGNILDHIFVSYFSGSPKCFLQFLLDKGRISLTDLQSLMLLNSRLSL